MRCLSLIALLLAACSDSSSTPPPVDAPVAIDADPAATCLVPASFGEVGATTGTAGTVQGNTTMTVTLDPGPPRDTFFVKLVPGNGPFAGGPVTTGTFPITGVDTDYNDCGACTHVIADIVAGSGPSKFYFADAGTLTISSLSPLAGSAQNLRLVETDISTGTPVANGCTTTITSISFTAS